MRNLKRALSLVMAMALIVGMMVVSASAASKDFTDADEIQHSEAVNTMVALNVISGKEDGSYFDPTGTLTRAEMAKIISYVMNGGVEPNIGTKVVPTYSDIDNHWAEAYIEYCTSMGIINGDGAGKFNPGGTLTASQAAKMFLTAMGYNAEVFGLVGNDWETNTNRYANEAGLYKELGDVSVSNPISRDDACQMAYNAIQAALMVRGWSQNQQTGQVTETYTLAIGEDGEVTRNLLSERFGALTFVGTFTNNADTKTSLKDGQIEVYGKLTSDEESTSKRYANFTADVDIANIGEEFKVIFKDGNGGTANRPDDRDTIYGVFNTGATEVLNTTKALIGDQKSSDSAIVVDGTEYSTTDSVRVYSNYINSATGYAANNGTSAANSALTTALKVQSVDAIKFVFDEDGNIFAAYITEYAAGRVTAVTSEKVTISGVGSIVIADNDVYEGIAVDDVVVYTKFYSSDKDKAYFTVTKAETVEGELEGYKVDTTTSNYMNVVVDGETYKVNKPATSLTALTDDGYTAFTSNNIGDTVRLYMIGGMVAGVDKVSDGESQYAVVTDVSSTGSLGSTLDPIRVVLLYADGTEATKIVHKDSTTNGSTAITTSNIHDGDLVKFTNSGDDQVKISLVETGTAITGTGSGKANVWNADTKNLTYTGTTTAVAASDAVAYVKVTSGGNTNYYAYSLRNLRTINNTVSGVVVGAIVDSDTGLVEAAYMELTYRPGGSTANTLYGIVSAYVGVRSIDDTTYYQYTVDTSADNSVTVYADDNTSIAAGDLVYFEESSDQTYDASADFHKLTSSNAVAVNSYNEAAKLLTYYTATSRTDASQAFTGTGTPTSVTMDDEAVVVYVDADGKKGGEVIGVSKFDGTTGYANAAIKDTDSDGLYDVIFVETSGEVNLLGNAAFGSVTTGTITNSNPSISGSGNGTYTVTVPGTAEVGATFNVTVACSGLGSGHASETVTVTYNSVSQNITFTAASSKTVSFTCASGSNAVTASVTASTPTT